MTVQEQAERAATEDTRLAVDMAALQRDWAELGSDEDGEALAMAYIRKAYGSGYIRALEDGQFKDSREDVLR